LSDLLTVVDPPNHWHVRRFDRLVDRVKDIDRDDLQPLSVFLGEGVVPRSTRDDNYNRLGEDLSKYLVVKPGDIVFNKLRTWQGGLGVSNYEGIVSPAYYVCRPRQDVEPRFLHYLLRSTTYLQELTRISKWMPPSQFDISWEDLRLLPTLLPSKNVQQAIADFLDAETARIDALIAKKRRLSTKLRERRAAIMLSGVAGKLLRSRKMVDSSLSWIEQRPEHWDEPLLKLVAQLGSGHTPSRSRPEWWVNCTIPWITTGEVSQMREDRIEYVTETREKISELGMVNSSAELHSAGTVVLSRTASAGFSAIMGENMATSQDFVTWTCGPLLDPRYLLLCLRAMRQDLLGRLAQGSTHQTIYMPDIESIRISLPPLEEQQEIVKAVWRSLNKIDKIIDLLNHQIELLTEHRQALITAAVTGQIEVPGAAASTTCTNITKRL